MPKHHYKVESQQVQMFLETYASQVGQATQFEQRRSKLSSVRFVQTLLVSGLEQPEASLNQMVQWSHDLGVTLTAQAFDQRLTDRAVDFLAELLKRAVRHFRRQTPLPTRTLEQFSSVTILDSTQVTLPDSLGSHFAGSGGNAAKASVKFHLSFDYLAGQVSALEAVDGRSPDQNCRLHRQALLPNSLHVFDLGYFEQGVLTDIAAAQAYFVCRLHPQVGVYATVDAPHALNMAGLVDDWVGDQYEFTAYVGNKTRLPVRILCQRLPPSLVEERRRKAYLSAQRHGKTYSQAYLTLLSWRILITNVPVEKLTFEQVMALYPIRWQIELIFKLWKSHAKLASVGQWRPQRVLCHLYARLLALVLFHWLVAPWRWGEWGELSLTKAFQVLQRHTSRLAQVIAHGWRGLAALLEKMSGDFLRFARKDKRQKSPSSLQSFIQLEA
jgi:hypothetical protein